MSVARVRDRLLDCPIKPEPSSPPVAKSAAYWARMRGAVYGAAIILAVIGLGLALRIDSRGGVRLPLLNYCLPDLCIFHAVTNLDCPGCGMARSFIALVHLDFVRAFSFNWAGPLVFVLLAFHLSVRLWSLINPAQAEAILRSKLLESYLKFVVFALLFAWAVRIFRQL